MKKLLTAFVAVALLTVCLCVPSFAIELNDITLPDVVPCEHISTYDEAVVYRESDLSCRFGCPVCHWSCFVLDWIYSGTTLNFTYSEFASMRYFAHVNPDMTAQFLGLACSHFASNPTIYACEDGHYISCSECDYYRPATDYTDSQSMSLEDCPHASGDPVCAMFSRQATIVPVSASSTEYFADIRSGESLDAASDVVTYGVMWISAFIRGIVDSPLLLCFFVIVFSGLGIGLIKRSIRL